MICLTGDLHHQSLGTGNQRHANTSELSLAGAYLELLREARVPVTFFVSGRAFDEQWSELEPIVRDPLVELGGHTHACFSPSWPHRVSKKLGFGYPGPPWLEAQDIDRTLASAARRTTKPVRVWRDHMYLGGPNTDALLRARGFVASSNIVSTTARGPSRGRSGLWNVPITVLPDHEHLFHAERTRAWVTRWQRRHRWSDAFGPESYEIDAWTDLVLAQLRANEARGALSTLIVHPITMHLCDGFDSFRKILAYLTTTQTVTMTEAVRVWAAKVGEAA